MQPESCKNTCGLDDGGGNKNTVACAAAQLETAQVWQVRSVKTDNGFSA